MPDILQHPGLKKIIVTEEINTRPLYFNFSDAANVDLLTQVFANMEEVEIHKEAGGHSTRCLVDAILNRSNKLKRVVLEGGRGGRDGVDSALLVTALNKIEVLEVYLYKDEANMLLKMMMQDETSVTSLSLLSHQW